MTETGRRCVNASAVHMDKKSCGAPEHLQLTMLHTDAKDYFERNQCFTPIANFADHPIFFIWTRGFFSDQDGSNLICIDACHVSYLILSGDCHMFFKHRKRLLLMNQKWIAHLKVVGHRQNM